MTPRTLALAVAGAVTLGAGSWWTVRSLSADDGRPGGAPLAISADLPPTMSQTALTAELIDTYLQRVAADPHGASDRATLAGLYLQRSRETGDFADYRRAESLARQSIAIRGNRNAKAYRMLAASLLAQHRFADARAAAEELVAAWPEDAAHHALLGEIQAELGDYDAARTTFVALRSARGQLAVSPRLARWAELSGEIEEEGRLLQESARKAYYRSDLPREQVAWFYLRLGERALRYGETAKAEQAFRDGLAEEPNDFRLVGALVRLEAQRGEWQRAVAYGEHLGDGADLRTLGVIGDAYFALGDRAAADRYYARLEAKAAANPEPFNRQWTMFRLDHDRHVPDVLALLQQEITVRTDVLGYDMLAWALYKSGRYSEAHEAMTRAMRLDTQDPTLFFHAGLIDKALGNADGAREHLKYALSLNPTFHHTQVAEARQALDEL